MRADIKTFKVPSQSDLADLMNVEVVRPFLEDEKTQVLRLRLFGKMGSGKTTLVKSLALPLGIEQNITSPTFNLMNSYQGLHGTLFHYDLYRLSSLDDITELGFDRLWNDSSALHKTIHAVEWSERGGGLFFSSVAEVNIHIDFDDEYESNAANINTDIEEDLSRPMMRSVTLHYCNADV